MLFTGSYRRSLDEKLRLAMPKQLRDALASGQGSSDKGAGNQGGELFITPGTDHSLAIYTGKVLEELGQRLAQSSPAAKDTRAFSRLFYAQAQPAEIDGQGRLRVPAELAKLARLTGEVVVLGVRDHIELWEAAAWDAFLAATQPSYDELAEKVLSGKILEQ
jgi:MraZ protein